MKIIALLTLASALALVTGCDRGGVEDEYDTTTGSTVTTNTAPNYNSTGTGDRGTGNSATNSNTNPQP